MEYIEREAFLAEQRHLYCENCVRRKGMKNGKMKFVYAIGDAPCRACDIGDMLDSVEDYPAADVAPVRHGRWVKARGSWFTPGGDPVWECSECGKGMHVYGVEHGSYGSDVADGQWVACPNCGAKMDVPDTDVGEMSKEET